MQGSQSLRANVGHSDFQRGFVVRSTIFNTSQNCLQNCSLTLRCMRSIQAESMNDPVDDVVRLRLASGSSSDLASKSTSESLDTPWQ